MGNQISEAKIKAELNQKFALATKEVVTAYINKSPNLEHSIDIAENILEQLLIENNIPVEDYLSQQLIPIVGLGLTDNLVTICDNILSKTISMSNDDVGMLSSILEDIKSREHFFTQ